MSAEVPDERFSRGTAPRPLVEAVTAFCESSGRNLEDMEQMTPHEIYELAAAHYAGQLPEFWRVWQDWHESDDVQPMGDL